MDSPTAPKLLCRRPIALLVLAVLFPAGLNLSLYWLHNPLYGHGLWVLPLAGLLAWRKLGGIQPSQPSQPGFATGVIIVALIAMPLLRLVQVANPDWRMLDWALSALAVIALLALSYRLGGRPVLGALWFPLCFLFTAVPWPTSLERAFTDHAVPATATLVSEALWVGKTPVVDDGRMLHTTVGPIEVSEDCSGIRGIQLAVMGALFWAGWMEIRRGRSLMLIGSAIGYALLLNVLRVIAIVLAALKAGKLEVAEQWHDPAGTAAQLALVAGLPVLAWAVRGKPQLSPPTDHTPVAEWSALPIRFALLAVLWIGLGEFAVEAWFRRNESHAQTSSARWTIHRPLPVAGAKEDAVAAVIRRNYRYSDGLAAEWKDTQPRAWSLLWLEFARGAQSACTHNVHKPEWCLPAQDFTLVKTFADLPVEIAGQTVPFQHHLYARRGAVMHLFFTLAQDYPGSGPRTWEDWTFAGRLRVAALGIRSQRSQMLHLSTASTAPVQDVRRAAAGYLRQITAPLPAVR